MYYTKKEEYLSKKRAVELWDKGIINEFEVGTFKGLRQIHRYLFKDVFDFAGKIRNVNLIKGNFRFTPLIFLESNIKIIDRMSEDNFNEIIEKYAEMNVAHPFKEGNGRATRIRLDLMLKKNLKKCVDWQKIDKMAYLQAMERSPVNALELKHLIKNALTKNTENRDIFIGGIERSYEYENQCYYKISDIK
jgi:cell filamentation protein